MKSLLVLSLITLATTAHAGLDCTAGTQKVLSTLAPTTKKVRVTGKYTKKGEISGEYKDCSIAVSLDEERKSLVLDFKHEEMNPLNGDGGAFWPFGSYPTYEPETNQYDRVVSYDCSATADSFSMDYKVKSKSGWRKTSRYIFGLEKNKDGSYSASLRAGQTDLFVIEKPVVCKGTISEVN